MPKERSEPLNKTAAAFGPWPDGLVVFILRPFGGDAMGDTVCGIGLVHWLDP